MTLQSLKTKAKNRGINPQFVRWFGGDLRKKQSWADAIEFVAVPADEVPEYEFITWSDYVDIEPEPEPEPEPPEVAAIPTTEWRGKSWDEITGVKTDPESQELNPKLESLLSQFISARSQETLEKEFLQKTSEATIVVASCDYLGFGEAMPLMAESKPESEPEPEPEPEPTPKPSEDKPPTVPTLKQDDPVLATFANSLISKLSNWKVGDRVVRREFKVGNFYYGNHGTVMEIEGQSLLIDWDFGNPRTAWIPVTSVIKEYISGPIDLPEPKNVDLDFLEISPATSIQIATANGLYEQNYRGFDVWISYLHGSIIGGAVCSQTKAWTFKTGCLGPLKNCYPSDSIVRRWFFKLVRRIIDERLIKESQKQRPIPCKLTFAFELQGDNSIHKFKSQVPANTQRFDMWVRDMACWANSVIRVQCSNYFNPQTWLFISIEGVEDRVLRSRILATVYHQFSSDDLGLIALKVDDDFTVVLTNDPNYGLGDSLAIVPSKVA